MPKKTQLSGLGSEAFFSEPAQEAVKPVRQQASKPVKKKEEEPEGPPLIKATFYLTEEHVTMLEELKLRHRRTGAKVDKSTLVRMAIELLAKQ